MKEGGRETPLTFRTRHEYAALVVATRLAESRRQAQAVRRGLENVVPQSMLSLLTWKELEVHVCGRPVVDVALLRANTEYNGCSKEDEHIKWFWRAMEEYSPEERAQYLRFVWGRSRLPLTAKDFGRKHVIEAMRHSDPDSVLPLAHTWCAGACVHGARKRGAGSCLPPLLLTARPSLASQLLLHRPPRLLLLRSHARPIALRVPALPGHRHGRRAWRGVVRRRGVVGPPSALCNQGRQAAARGPAGHVTCKAGVETRDPHLSRAAPKLNWPAQR